jgi:hypothetical protein
VSFLRRAHVWADIEKVCMWKCCTNRFFSGVQLEALSRW